MSDKHPCRLFVLDVRFKRDADMDALLRALDPPDDVLDNLSINGQGKPDGLDRRLEAWGYAGDPYGEFRNSGRLTTLGVYGDFTLFEDDERFVQIIAPYVEADSRIVFDKGRKPLSDDYSTGNSNFWDEYQGWHFDGTRVTLRPVEKIVEFEWAQ